MDVASDVMAHDMLLEKEAVWRGLPADLCILYGLQCLFSKGPIRLEFARECFDRAAKTGRDDAAQVALLMQSLIDNRGSVLVPVKDDSRSLLLGAVLGLLFLRDARPGEARYFFRCAQGTGANCAFGLHRHPDPLHCEVTRLTCPECEYRERRLAWAPCSTADCLRFAIAGSHAARRDAVAHRLGSIEQQAYWLGILASQTHDSSVRALVEQFWVKDDLYRYYLLGKALSAHGYGIVDYVSKEAGRDCVVFYLEYRRFVSQGVYELMLCLAGLLPRPIRRMVGQCALAMHATADWLEAFQATDGRKRRKTIDG